MSVAAALAPVRAPAAPTSADGPAGRRIELDVSVRVRRGGELLLGGSPPRVVRLSAAGAAHVAGWRRGEPVAADASAQRLATRLIDAGLAHPRPGGPGERAPRFAPDDVTVVVPAHDRAAELAACLARVGRVAAVIVVDDGSRDPAAITAAAGESGARVLRHSSAQGPAAARNTGLAQARTPLVAFLDSDTVPQDGWLAAALPAFDDARLGALAARVRVPAGRGALAAYEAARSPLDMGPAPALVGPGRRIGYVPAAALLARRDALGTGFDVALRYGEDVDLVWRLCRAGWSVRYEPASRVAHPHRATAAAWLAQRAAYGSAAGPLAARHPGTLRHLVLPVWTLPPWALALLGYPRTALAATVASTAVGTARLGVAAELRGPVFGLAARTQLDVSRSALTAIVRAYPPLLGLGALLAPRAGRRVLGALAVGAAADWATRRPRLDPVRYAGLRAADDLAYAAGLWAGCARTRRFGPLVPLLTGWRRARARPMGSAS